METTRELMIDARGLRRVYGAPPNEVVAVDGVDFQVRRGEMVAVTGQSGSGKSTLLSLVGALETPTSGELTVAGVNLRDADAGAMAILRRRRIGFVFQEFNLLAGLTAAENVAAPLELDGAFAAAARRRALERLEAVGLGDRADAFPDDLSGGERQRVAIARALVGKRTLLLADEPTGALDSRTAEEVMRLLHAACTPESAVVVVTHDRSVAQWAHRSVHLHDGRVASEDPAGAR